MHKAIVTAIAGIFQPIRLGTIPKYRGGRIQTHPWAATPCTSTTMSQRAAANPPNLSLHHQRSLSVPSGSERHANVLFFLLPSAPHARPRVTRSSWDYPPAAIYQPCLPPPCLCVPAFPRLSAPLSLHLLSSALLLTGRARTFVRGIGAPNHT